MKAYFDELSPKYNVSFVEEIEPLGTAGSLRYLNGKFATPFFVTNCDIIINIDYANLMKYHKEEKNDITLVASTKEYIIPYGTCELSSNGDLSHINEKPKYDFLINTGLYILNPELLDLIPENKFYHITHLIEDSKNLGNKVGVYPIDDSSWFDVGEWAEYKKTVKKSELVLSVNHIAIIGLGSIGRRYVRLIKTNYPKIELTIVRSGKGSSYPEEALADRAIKSINDLKGLGVKAAIVSSPATHHLKQGLALVNHGIHTLIEKPLSHSSLGIRKLIKTISSKKVIVSVGYVLRYDPVLNKIKSYVDNGLIGK